MPNRLHILVASHVVAPLDAIYARIDEDQLDGAQRPEVATLAGAARPRTPMRLRHLTH